MHKLRRMHIANAGYKSAFFEAETWRFYDTDSDEPVDTVLYAGNGSGKTTSLALLFSVIDTSVNRFLRRLTHSHESFDQYFNDEPGLVALEWDRGRDGRGRPLSPFVTAQIVTKRRDGAEKRTDRLFVAFRADPRFGFEGLPFAGLGRTYETRLKTRDELSRWVMECTHHYQDTHSFYRTDNQGDWQKHLEEAGIDVVLLSKQVDLNRHEGGLDEFLKFPNEKSFLDRFLSLTLPEERARLVREDLREGISKLSGYDVLRDRLAVMRSLEESHALFRDGASRYLGRAGELEDARAEAAGLRIAMEDRAGTLASEIEALVEDESSTAARVRDDRQRRLEMEDERSACEVEIKRREAEQISREHLELENARDGAKRRLDHLDAALAWKPIERLENEIDELKKALAREEKSLEAPRKDAEAAGSELVSALDWHIERSRAELAARTSRKAALEEMEQECKKSIEHDDLELKQQRESLGGVTEWLKRFDDERQNLIRREDLHESELSATALLRCDAEIKRADDELQSLKSRLSAIKEEQRGLNEARINLGTRKAEKKADLKVLRGRLGEGKENKRSLAADPFILKVCREKAIDLESTAVQKQLSDFRDDTSRRILDAERLTEIKKADAESINRWGLAAIDENTEQVASFLGSKGIRDVIPYPAWLASLEWEPRALREFVMADPARFTGVAVQGEEAFEKTRGLDFGQIRLTRPVVVSRAAEEPGEIAPMSFVIPVSRTEAYDRDAARRLAENIEQEISELSEAVSRSRRDQDAATKAINAVDSYIEKWGRGQLGNLESKSSAMEREISRILKEIDGVKTSIESLQEEQAGREERRERIEKAFNVLEVRRDRLRDFRERWEKLSEGKLEELNSTSMRIKDFEERLISLRARRDGTADDIEKTKEEIRDIEQEIGKLGLERDKVQMRGARIDACPDPERLDAIRARYRQREESYRDMMQDRFGLLQIKYEEKVKTRDERLEGFGKLHKECDMNEVREMARLRNLEDLFTEGKKAHGEILEKAAEKAFAKKTARKAHELALRSLSANARYLLPSLGEGPQEALAAREEAARAEKERLGRSIPTSEEHLKAVRDEIGKTRLKETACRSFLNLLQDTQAGRIINVSLELDEEALTAQVRRIRDRMQNASRAVDKAKDEAFKAYETVKTRADQEDFRRLEPRIAGDLRYNRLEEAIWSASEHGKMIGQHIASIEDDIGSMKENISILVQRLSSLLTESLGLLRKACDLGVIPADVPRLGGQQVLRMNRNIRTASQDYKEQTIEAYLDRLVRDNRVPETGHELAGGLVDFLRDRMGLDDLGIKILKPTDTGPLTHCEIHRVSSSGGEGLTAALLLYLILSRIRAESLAESQSTLGGVLIADNPFGKATHSLFLKSQRALARAMRIQLIFTSQVKDFDALGEFPHVIKYAKKEERQAMGQTLVRLAHELIGEPPAD